MRQDASFLACSRIFYLNIMGVRPRKADPVCTVQDNTPIIARPGCNGGVRLLRVLSFAILAYLGPMEGR
jgi:hypothetical protein